jgi:hypothetical protein
MPAVRLANISDSEQLTILEPILYSATNLEINPIITRLGNGTGASCDLLLTDNEIHEAAWSTAQEAIGHGILSGASETLKYGLQRKGYSREIAEKAKQAAYLVTMFTWNFCSSFSSQDSSQDVWHRTTTSACEAGINTAKLFAVQAGAFIASKAANSFSPTSRVGRAARFVSSHVRLGIFAVQSAQDPSAAVISILTGGISEAATASAGKAILNRGVTKRPFS